MTTRLGLVAAFVLAASVTFGAQSPPPINGVTGATFEGTTNAVYRALNVVVVKTIDGVEHMVHYTKDLLVHGGKGKGVDALQGLKEGSTVVVHYTMTGAQETALEIDRVGDEGLKKTEGVVSRVDRGRRQITIRFADGTTENLQMTPRAAAEADTTIDEAAAGGTKVLVYYSDERGGRVAHYFKRVS